MSKRQAEPEPSLAADGLGLALISVVRQAGLTRGVSLKFHRRKIIMDPVDVLTMSVSAAQALRAARDAEAALDSAYGVLGQQPPDDRDDDLAIRIVRLMAEAGQNRSEVLLHLTEFAQGLYGNRLPGGWGRETEEGAHLDEPDPEALRLRDHATEGWRSVFREGFGPFKIATRSVPVFFGGHTVIERDGKGLSTEQAGELQEGDRLRYESEGLPPRVRGLIDYPVATPVLFEIETGAEPWSVWDICCAFAYEYEKIYENPLRYGVWGHDLTDLVIERLMYSPEERLIYASIGS